MCILSFKICCELSLSLERVIFKESMHTVMWLKSIFLKNIKFLPAPYVPQILVLVIMMLWVAFPAWANEERPSFKSSRYEENYRFLHDPSQRTNFFDPIKYIPLNKSESVYLSFGGETRQHYEYIDNNNWGKGAQDTNGYYLQRYLGHADLHLGESIRLFGQLMSGIESGRNGGPRGVDKDWLDLNQAFFDYQLWKKPGQLLTVRAGRQEIVFGSRRFFNYRERPNMRLSHDAVTGIFRTDNWDVRAFGARPVALGQNVFDNKSRNKNTVWGLYGVRQKFPVNFSLNTDLYYLGLYNRDAVYDQGGAEETRHTVGTRIWGKGKNLDYNFEFLYQFGEFGRGNIRAYALASDTGYTIPLSGPAKVRFSLRADVYSGDDDPADADLNSFNPFFPKGKHISQLAASGLINQRDLHPRITLTLDEHWSVTASTLFIWRDSLNDGVYSIGNGLLRTGQSSRARYVGAQPELEAKYTFNRHLDLKGIFIYFRAGKFLKQTSPGRDISYLGSMLTFRF